MDQRRFNLYDNPYAHYESEVQRLVRAETYGEDIGQNSWLTAAEWRHFAECAGVAASSEVLEVGCGSGGPAVWLAEQFNCLVTGVDINDNGIRNAGRLAQQRGLQVRTCFQVADAGQPLPFDAERFDVVLSNDAMCHLPARAAVLADWRRLLRPGGRMLFTDALVVTGLLTHDEIATRSSIGLYVFAAPGVNETMIGEAGFRLLEVEDVTEAAAEIADRRREARFRHREQLVAIEGEEEFAGLQRFLACVHEVAAQRRLSRFAYLAEVP